MSNSKFEITVSNATFSAAHLPISETMRGRLHGHTYNIQVTVCGTMGADGFVIDFYRLQELVNEKCGELHQRTLIPGLSKQIEIRKEPQEIEVRCHDQARYVFPALDVFILPCEFSSTEAIAKYLAGSLQTALGISFDSLSVEVQDIPGRSARFTIDS